VLPTIAAVVVVLLTAVAAEVAVALRTVAVVADIRIANLQTY